MPSAQEIQPAEQNRDSLRHGRRRNRKADTPKKRFPKYLYPLCPVNHYRHRHPVDNSWDEVGWP
jgi:hypothetical protein